MKRVNNIRFAAIVLIVLAIGPKSLAQDAEITTHSQKTIRVEGLHVASSPSANIKKATTQSSTAARSRHFSLDTGDFVVELPLGICREICAAPLQNSKPAKATSFSVCLRDGATLSGALTGIEGFSGVSIDGPVAIPIADIKEIKILQSLDPQKHVLRPRVKTERQASLVLARGRTLDLQNVAFLRRNPRDVETSSIEPSVDSLNFASGSTANVDDIRSLMSFVTTLRTPRRLKMTDTVGRTSIVPLPENASVIEATTRLGDIDVIIQIPLDRLFRVDFQASPFEAKPPRPSIRFSHRLQVRMTGISERPARR